MEKFTQTRFLTFPRLERLDMIKSFYFFIHISFAIIITYLPAFMSASGYSGKQIALLMSIGFVLVFFVPLLFGIIADRTQRPALIMRILLLLTIISLIPFLTPGIGYVLLMVAYFFYSFFHVPVMGIADSIATAKANEDGTDYGKIRMWAALGWFIAVSGFGIIMDYMGFGPESPWLFAVLIVSFIVVFLISLTITEREPQRKDPLKLSEIKHFFRIRSFNIFLVAVVFHYISMAPFGQFVGPLVQELGMSQSVLGMTAGMATGIEVLVLLAFGWLSMKFRLEAILLMAVIVTGIRWFLVSIVTTAIPLILIQSLHGATAGLFIAGAVTLVGNLAPKGMKVSGQMLYVLAGVGVGNLIGTNLAGFLFDYFGSIQKTFLVAAFIEIIPAILFIYLLVYYKKQNALHLPE